MKNNFYLLGLCLSMLVMFSNCKKEQEAEQTSITTAINKIETSFKEGDIKIETYDSTAPKTETIAPQEYKDSIYNALLKSYSKLKSATDLSDLIGVFKDVSCGSNRELHVYMDNQDNGTSNSKVGYTGASYLDSKNNVHLYFCLVDRSSFNDLYTTIPFAVLTFNGGSAIFKRYFDNEDDSNSNYVVNGKDGEVSAVKNLELGWCTFGNNTWLAFDAHIAVSPTNSQSFPSLGFSYYVLGQGSDNTRNGYIWNDDEDNKNANQLIFTYVHGTYSSNVEANFPEYFSNVFEGGKNSKFYLTRIN